MIGLRSWRSDTEEESLGQVEFKDGLAQFASCNHCATDSTAHEDIHYDVECASASKV